MLELYFFHGATCGLKARLAFAEKQLDYDGHAVTRDHLRTEAYRKLNPQGVVPTLIHDGEIILESSVILNYVDDAFDGPPLKIDGPLGTARAWWWMKRADECLPYIGTFTYTVSMRPKILEKTPEELEAYIEGIPRPANRARRRAIIEQGYDSPYFPMAAEGLTRMLSDMESALGKNKWLAGGRYSLADTAMSPLVERLHELAFDGMWENRPGVADWWERIRARPSYDACLADTPNPEGLQHRAAGEKAWPEVREVLPA